MKGCQYYIKFDECKLAHYENMNEREWLLGDESVDELYEYKLVSRFVSLSRLIQSTRLKLKAFLYKVYINGLLNVLTNHCYSISVNRLFLPSHSFADDVTLLALYPTFFHTFMEMCYKYSIKWRYEFNHIKSGVVTFG